MADYFPLIARAVQALSEQSPEMRGAVYERARAALIGQLRSLDPPLSEEEIADETVSLDAAIADVEAAYSPEAFSPEAYAPEPEPAPDAGYAPAPYPEAEQSPDRGEWPAREEQPEPESEREPEEWSEPEPPQVVAPIAAAPRGPTGGFRSESPSEAAIAEAPRSPASQDTAQPTPGQTSRPQVKSRPRLGSVAPRGESGGGLRMAIVAASIALVIGAIAFVAFRLAGDDTVPMQTAQPVAEAPSVDEEGKITERIEAAPPAAGEAAAPAEPAAPATGVAVTQRAILYEEDPVNPQGEPRAAGGGAVWMLDPPPAGSGDPSVRAVVEIPDAGLTMTMAIRRNLDATLPASHTIELIFNTTGREGRTVRDIGLLQLKEEEVVRGAPIAGLPVPVQDNLFLIGLSNVAADTQRNRNLLAQRNWIDIPIRFSNGQRAIVSFEKGVSGEQAFARAFEAWDR
ncbi:MAG: histidine kinase [Microvirga sp.]|nr:histidine kinase [Microvirga sp.]